MIRYLVWPQVILPVRVLLSRPSLIVCPNYISPWIFRNRCFVIIHDASSFRSETQPLQGATYSGSRLLVAIYHWYNRHMIRCAARSAACLVAPSQITRDRIQTIIGHTQTPFVVVPWAGRSEWADEPTYVGCEATSEPYLLAVNPHSLAPLLTVVRAINRVRADRNHSGLHLRVVGYLSRCESQLPDGETSEVRLMGRVDEGELKTLYLGALAMVINTVENGFGLPALEAMSAGTPCIVRSGSAEAEITGGWGALEVDGSEADWTRAIRLLLESNVLWKRLSREAILRSRSFSWDKVGEAFAVLIEELS